MVTKVSPKMIDGKIVVNVVENGLTTTYTFSDDSTLTTGSGIASYIDSKQMSGPVGPTGPAGPAGDGSGGGSAGPNELNSIYSVTQGTSQFNIPPTSRNSPDWSLNSNSELGWTTCATRTIDLTGSKPLAIIGSIVLIGVHQKGTGKPVDTAYDNNPLSTSTIYDGKTWIYNKRSTWYMIQAVLVAPNGATLFSPGQNGIILGEGLGDVVASPVNSTFPAPGVEGSYSLKIQVKCDENPDWTTVDSAVEGFAARQGSLIAMEF